MLLEALNIFGLYISKFNNGKVKSFGAKDTENIFGRVTKPIMSLISGLN